MGQTPAPLVAGGGRCSSRRHVHRLGARAQPPAALGRQVQHAAADRVADLPDCVDGLAVRVGDLPVHDLDAGDCAKKEREREREG